MNQLTIFDYLDRKEDYLFNLLEGLKVNENFYFKFGQVKKNEVGIFEFKNNQIEKAFIKLIDCYSFIFELENKK